MLPTQICGDTYLAHQMPITRISRAKRFSPMRKSARVHPRRAQTLAESQIVSEAPDLLRHVLVFEPSSMAPVSARSLRRRN